MAYLSEEVLVTLAGVPCVRFLSISPSLDPKKDHTIIVSVTLAADRELVIESALQFDAMHIPDGSIEDDIDKMVALSSAEALLDVDGLLVKAAERIHRFKKALAIGVTNE